MAIPGQKSNDISPETRPHGLPPGKHAGPCPECGSMTHQEEGKPQRKCHVCGWSGKPAG